jgi:hypothetical protein
MTSRGMFDALRTMRLFLRPDTQPEQQLVALCFRRAWMPAGQ